MLTYNVDMNNSSSESMVDNTILVHRKKQTNTLYTINALNELIKSLNNGVLDKTFAIDWENYKNCILLIQTDGFVIFPHQWDDSWLEYDYIGAPWPVAEGCYLDPWENPQRVGNGGFCLMSKKLLSVPDKVEVPWEINDSDFYKMPEGVRNYHGDGNVCCHNRHIYVEQGCKFAPLEVAVKFSQETRLPECDGIVPFGFHYHLPPGVELT